MKTISSQHYIDEEIVAAKLAAQDFEVLVSPEFEYEGVTVRVVLDGHHSLAAAKLAGVEPEYTTATATECDQIGWLDRGDAETFLEVSWMGGDYYDVNSQESAW